MSERITSETGLFTTESDGSKQISSATHAVEDTSVAARLAVFARSVRLGGRSVEEVVEDILVNAVDMIQDADAGCVTTLRRGTRTIVASTDPIAETLCRLQYELGEGPIDNELWHLDTVVSDDLQREGRWPAFADSAVDSGMRSLAAFRLYTGKHDLGALVLYSSRADGFGADDVIVGEAIAAHAAIALLSVQERRQFETALASRDIIGQAKGMLMERYDIDALRAFELLVALSQERNQPLHSVATAVVEADHPVIAHDEQRTGDTDSGSGGGR